MEMYFLKFSLSSFFLLSMVFFSFCFFNVLEGGCRKRSNGQSNFFGKYSWYINFVSFLWPNCRHMCLFERQCVRVQLLLLLAFSFSFCFTYVRVRFSFRFVLIWHVECCSTLPAHPALSLYFYLLLYLFYSLFGGFVFADFVFLNQ